MFDSTDFHENVKMFNPRINYILHNKVIKSMIKWKLEAFGSFVLLSAKNSLQCNACQRTQINMKVKCAA